MIKGSRPLSSCLTSWATLNAEEQSPAVEMPNTARCAEKQSSALTVQRGRLSVSSTILTRRAALKSNCPHSSRRGRVHERLT